jgi:hypothetical protein
MKAPEEIDPESDMRDEYDFSSGIRGKYARRFAEGTNVVVLDADIAAEFGSAKAVNDALRAYLAERRAKAASGG